MVYTHDFAPLKRVFRRCMDHYEKKLDQLLLRERAIMDLILPFSIEVQWFLICYTVCLNFHNYKKTLVPFICKYYIDKFFFNDIHLYKKRPFTFFVLIKKSIT